MKKKRWIIGGIIAIAVVLAGAMMLLPGLLSAGQSANAAPMEIQTVASLRSAQRQLISGAVHPAESENFYVDATKGKVDEIKVVQGAQVKKDDELYAYANPALATQLEKLRIQYDSAAKREARLETQLANLNRDIRNAPTTEVADQLKDQREQLREQIDTVRTEARLATLDIEETQDQIAALTVRANFDGIVEMVNEDERNAVGQGAATKPLIRLVSNLPYEIRGTLSELQRAQIKPDQPFVATSKALPGQRWKGTVSYVSTFPKEAASGSQGMESSQVQYEFVGKLETQENLVPGTTLFLEINVSGSDAFAVPSGAVLRDGASSQIFVVENNKLKKQSVTTGPDEGGETTITSPMDDRAEILLNPTPETVEGTDVIR